MTCELKQTVPSLGREFTPAEIRKPDGSFPPWVAETGIPAFFIRFYPQWLENRVIRLGNQTISLGCCSRASLGDRVICRSRQTNLPTFVVSYAFDGLLIPHGSRH